MVSKYVKCAHAMPIAECTEHWPQYCEMTGYTIERRALEWALGEDTGTSSQALCAYMLGVTGPTMKWPPSDASDRGRCIRLLKLIPEWLPRLPELAKDNPGGVKSNTWATQIILILKEGAL